MSRTLQSLDAPAGNPPRRWAAAVFVAALCAAAAWGEVVSFTALSNMPMGRRVSANDLWEELDRSLPEGVWISPLQNESYQVVSARWMRRSFLPTLRREMRTLWDKDIPADNSAGNCNGLTLVARLLLNISAMSARAPAPAAATLIVRHERDFGGLPATHVDHSVAYVLTDEGPWIIEVQSGTAIPLRDYPNREFIRLVNFH